MARANGRRKDLPPETPTLTANGARVGRPPREFSDEQVATIRKLAGIQCSLEEIAAWPTIDCSVDTLERRFAEVIEKGRLEGRASLKRTQFAKAVGYAVERKDGTVYTREPDTTMLIWLGKVVLGQRETTLTQMTGPDGRPLEFRDVGGLSDREVAERAAGILSMAEARARKATAAAPKEETGT
jgi:hypothetical protein